MGSMKIQEQHVYLEKPANIQFKKFYTYCNIYPQFVCKKTWCITSFLYMYGVTEEKHACSANCA